MRRNLIIIEETVLLLKAHYLPAATLQPVRYVSGSPKHMGYNCTAEWTAPPSLPISLCSWAVAQQVSKNPNLSITHLSPTYHPEEALLILVILSVGFKCQVIKVFCFHLLEEAIENNAHHGVCRNVQAVHNAAFKTFNVDFQLRSK